MLYYVKLTALSIKNNFQNSNSFSLADTRSLMRCAPLAPEVRPSRPKFADLD